MREACHGGWGDIDGEANFMAEICGGEVTSCAVDENAGTEENGAVDLVVEALCDEVVRGGVVVCPCFMTDLFCGYSFDFVYVEKGFEWRRVFAFYRLLIVGSRLGEGFGVDGA
jgi:hypothetical protein